MGFRCYVYSALEKGKRISQGRTIFPLSFAAFYLIDNLVNLLAIYIYHFKRCWEKDRLERCSLSAHC